MFAATADVVPSACPMTLSHNVTFVGNVPRDPEYEHPLGATLARDLFSALNQRGLPVSEPENWRDVGWAVAVGHGEEMIDIRFSSIGTSEWLLQIAPTKEPTLPASLFRRSTTGRSHELYEVARTVAEILPTLGFSRFRWRVDGKPREGDPSAPPPPAA